MKTIQTLPLWNDGSIKNAEVLEVYVVGDDLNQRASFYYKLMTIDLIQLASGNITMDGQDYSDYETNQYAWEWVATKLGLTITGDYVPPVIQSEPPPAEIIPSIDIPVDNS